MDLDQLYHQDDADIQAAYLESRMHLLDRLLSQQALYQRVVRDATRLPIVTEWRDQDGHHRTHVINVEFLCGHRSLIRSLTRDLLELGDDGLEQLRRIQERHAADDRRGS
jgi:hypothetical protein